MITSGPVIAGLTLGVALLCLFPGPNRSALRQVAAAASGAKRVTAWQDRMPGWLSRISGLQWRFGLLAGAVCWLLGVSFTVFLGAMSLQGVTSASIDGVAIRAAKYAVDNFVPVVGGMFSDTMDTLVGCTLIVKNALGVAAVLVLIGALIGPMIRTLAIVFMLRLSAALLEPIADGDIVCAIGDFSRTIVLFFITMLCVGTMYFLLIVQVLLVGNLTVLLR